ncbi:MAG: rhomboid family intramembrane serine protease [Candidatus Pacearchaeota archaeon]
MIFSQDFVLRNIAISFDNISQLKLWTFFTSMFMHAGLIHLLANMFSLFFVGGLVEKIIGKKRYFWFYILSGFFAGVFFIISELFFFSGLPAVGASGAIFGLIGLLVILTPNLPVYIMLMPIPIKMKYAGPIMLVVLWLISIFGRIPIGNMAHFGGLIVGIIYGVYLKNKYKRKTEIIRRYFS